MQEICSSIKFQKLSRPNTQRPPLTRYTASPQVSWTQNEDDVEVTIALPKGVKGRDISVTIKYNMVKFALKNGHSMPEESSKDKTLLQRLLTGLEPTAIIDPELSTWTLADGQLVISLTKKSTSYWRYPLWLPEKEFENAK